MDRWMRRAREALLALAAALCLAVVPAAAGPPVTPATPAAAAQAAEAAPRPAIWLLADEDTRIYLFGTLHVLPPGLEWRSAAVERIVEEADELVMEVAELPGPDQAGKLTPHLMLGKQVPLLSRVSPDRRAALSEMVGATGLPLAYFDDMQTWAAAMTIAAVGIVGELGGTGDSPPPGVEEALTEDFRERGRPISGIETGPLQLSFFSRLSLAAQREMLEAMIDEFRAERGGTDSPLAPYEAWARGDVASIGEEAEAFTPAVFDALVTRRNRAWTDWLAARLERPGTVLFAVGAGHLAGRDSLQEMLAERGLEVSRVD